VESLLDEHAFATSGRHGGQPAYTARCGGARSIWSLALTALILATMMIKLRRALISIAALIAIVATSSVLAVPAQATTFTTRCVVAREMRIYHTATSTKPGRTKLYFGKTIYTDRKSHGRYRAWWWTLAEGWHRGWISANPKYTDRRECGQLA
jgi:hypothetical protein